VTTVLAAAGGMHSDRTQAWCLRHSHKEAVMTYMRKRGRNDVVVGVLLIAVMIGVGDLSAQGTPSPGSPGPTQPNISPKAPGSAAVPVQSPRNPAGAPGKPATTPVPPGADPAKQIPPEVVAPADPTAAARCQRITNTGERDACMKRIPGSAGGIPR
jgi:hypothetical protein